jgi:Protein of unknown function (DUF3108)
MRRAVRHVAAIAAITPALAWTQAPAGACAVHAGERAEYAVKYGVLRVGSGAITVDSDSLRGSSVWRMALQVSGGVPFFHVDEHIESWFQPDSLRSLRFVQHLREGSRKYDREYDFYPERRIGVDQAGKEFPSVEAPLDDASFIFFLRLQPLEVGRTYVYSRYFRADANPVSVTVLRRERVEVPAGTFDAVVVRPIIKTSGVFRENGRAEVWLADDSTRILLKMSAHISFGSLTVQLRHFTRGDIAMPIASRACANGNPARVVPD